MQTKTTSKKHSCRLLIAVEHFYSQIDLAKLTIVKGEPGNSLNKKFVYFLDASPLQM